MKNRIQQDSEDYTVDTVEGHGTMEGHAVPIPDKLKKHLIDSGNWDELPGELKYLCAMIGQVQEQMSHEAGEHVPYLAALDELKVQEPARSGLASILPD